MDQTKFHALVISSGFEDGKCWEWRGCRRDGYTFVYFEGKQIGAHRASYITFKEPIPPGLTIDHLCRNRACINPAHLEAVTIRENILRGDCEAARNARKTHCLRGHEMVFSDKSGYRWCQKCSRERYLKKFTPKHLDGKPGAHRKPNCKNGHIYDGTEKVYKGARICRQCRRDIDTRYKVKKRIPT